MQLRHIKAIAISTYREAIRQKVLYSVLFFLIIMLGIATLFGTVTLGDRVLVIKDFGMFSLTFFTCVYAVLSGASLLFKELNQKTVYNLLGKAVHRRDFLLGKFFGLFGTGLVLLALMTPIFLGFVTVIQGSVPWELLLPIATIGLQIMVVAALVIFFSTIVITPALSGAFAFSIFLAGRSSAYILKLSQVDGLLGSTKYLLSTIYTLLPHFDKLDSTERVLYWSGVSPEFYFWGLVYASTYSAILLFLGGLLFAKRNL